MLHLEFFCSGNLTHFHLEWRKTNWNAIVYEQSRECQNVHLTQWSAGLLLFLLNCLKTSSLMKLFRGFWSIALIFLAR